MKKVNEFLKTNIFIVLYAAITVFIEFLAILVTSGKLRMTRPGIFLTILAAGILILSACRKQLTRYIVSSALILIHSVFCLVFITSFSAYVGHGVRFRAVPFSQRRPWEQ